MRYIGVVLAAAVACFASIGWFGYQNLRNIAVAVAERQVRDEVTKQVKDKLTKEDINEVVRLETKEFASGELRTDLKHEIEEGPLHHEIVQTAASQSRVLLIEQLGPRHLDAANAKSLKYAINREPELLSFPVSVTGLFQNVDSYEYSEEIKKAIKTSKASLIPDDEASAYGTIADGVTVYYDKRKSSMPAEAMSRALQAAGIKSRIVSTSFVYAGLQGRTIEGPNTGALNIFVGSKPLPTKRIGRIKG